MNLARGLQTPATQQLDGLVGVICCMYELRAPPEALAARPTVAKASEQNPLEGYAGVKIISGSFEAFKHVQTCVQAPNLH